MEEILTNAVYHRSYRMPEPTTVRITPDEMEVTSFPGFDRSISEDAIVGRRIRARGYRNRRIGDYLKELGMTEGRNTGFPTAFAAMEANGSGDIDFESFCLKALRADIFRGLTDLLKLYVRAGDFASGFRENMRVSKW